MELVTHEGSHDMTLQEEPVTPYGSAALRYWELGWRGVLPLPPRAKSYPPKGWTGRGGPEPSYADVYAWAESHSGGNIALRLPRGVLGIDVDDYGDKHGGRTIETLEAQYGPLPATWRSSARPGTISGIRFYRIPEGLRWPGELQGGCVELIQHVHRYAVVAPSINPDTGSQYRWYDPDGHPSLSPPSPDDLPELPDAWISGLTGGEEDTEGGKVEIEPLLALGWANEQPNFRSEEICPPVEGCLLEFLADPAGSMHEHARHYMMRLVRMIEHQHHGGEQALLGMYKHFLAETTRAGRPGQRSERAAQEEWNRMLSGAVGKVLYAPEGASCDCYGDLERELDEWIESQPDPLAPAATETGSDEVRPDLPTWGRVDLTAYVTGRFRPPEPTILPRTDEVCLFYPGETHSVHGESESGKSLVAQIACAEQLRKGRSVLYVDFESDPLNVSLRMLRLGCTKQQILDLFDYRQPERSPKSPRELAAWQDMLSGEYSLAVIDGVTGALGVFGIGSGSVTNDNDTITEFMRKFPMVLAKNTGAAVVMVDHVVKNGDSTRFAIGGQAKMSAITGAAYIAKMTKQLGIDSVGEVELRIGKDRPGAIRAQCGDFRTSDQSQLAARVSIDSTGPTTNWTVHAPDTRSSGGSFRPTVVMERVSRLLEGQDGAFSSNAIAGEMGGRKDVVLKALAVLVEEGYLSREPLGRGGLGHRSVRPYRESDEVDEYAKN